MALTWEDYAELTPKSRDGAIDGKKVYKVQINDAGEFRCSCKGYVFCRVKPKSCKHTRLCAADQIAAGTRAMPVLLPPLWSEAATMLDAVLTAGRVFANEAQTRQMTEALAARLGLFNPDAMVTVASSVVTAGLRRITFDDD